MNNLHRELAPVSAAAWASIEDEARRTFTLDLAGRRVADVRCSAEWTLAAVGTGHLAEAAAPADGVTARLRDARPLTELTVPFTVSRQAVDDVERGAKDPDWQPVRDAVRAMARAEDRAIFGGYPAGGIPGLQAGRPGAPAALPEDARRYPQAVEAALDALRTAGVGGPYALVLGAAEFAAVGAAADHGVPVRDHLARMLDGPIHRGPAVGGAFVLSARGGDFELFLAPDLSIGYDSHDAEQVRLYFTEALTFLVHAPEAAVWLSG